jgi:hypothetical protein
MPTVRFEPMTPVFEREDSLCLTPVYPNILPYPLIQFFIYEYPLSSLPPPIPQTFFYYFLRLAKWLNDTN